MRSKAISMATVIAVAGIAASAGAASGAGADAGVAPPAPILRHSIHNSQVRVMPRSANGRDYQLYVYLPSSYDAQPARKYPVLYICDGYWDFGLLAGFLGGLVYDKDAPEMIIVGFGYPGASPDYDKLRRYDLTPVPAPDDPKARISGHAPEFLRAIETEFIPFVEREYRADPSYRVLGGSSLGGLFALYAMLERPGLFQGYIAPSPAVEWANGWLLGREAEFAAKHHELRARLFMSGAGEEWPAFLAAIRRFDEQLRGRNYAGLTYKWRLVDGERHAGTKPESYNRGVRFVFAPLAPSPNEK
jgi:predicted alpha/beta superfamily hydrolase